MTRNKCPLILFVLFCILLPCCHNSKSSYISKNENNVFRNDIEKFDTFAKDLYFKLYDSKEIDENKFDFKAFEPHFDYSLYYYTKSKKIVLISLVNLKRKKVVIEGFPNLKKLRIDKSSMFELIVKNLPELEFIDLGIVNLKIKNDIGIKIKLENLIKVKKISICEASEKSVNFEIIKTDNLEELDLIIEGLNSFSFANFSKLKTIQIRHWPDLREINLSNMPELTSLNLEGAVNIQSIDLKNVNKIKKLTLPNFCNSKLQSISLDENNLLYPGVVLVKYEKNLSRKTILEKFYEKSGKFIRVNVYKDNKIIELK